MSPSNYYLFLSSHLQKNSTNVLPNSLSVQFRLSFHLHHFTKIALVKMINDFHPADSNGHLSFQFELDLPEAFDTLYHSSPWKYLLRLASRTPYFTGLLPLHWPFLLSLHWCFILISFSFQYWNSPWDHSLVLYSLYTYFLNDLIQSHCFKYHLHADNSQSYTSSLDPFIKLHAHVFNFLYSEVHSDISQG